MKKITLLLLSFIIIGSLKSQCTAPSYTVNLASSDETWTLTSITRSGVCCGSSNCITFNVTTNPGTELISFDVTSPAPSGAAFYQVNCGPPISIGKPLCAIGLVSPFTITYCKPGGDSPTYIISASTINHNDTACSGIANNFPLTFSETPSYIWTATDNPNTTGESLSPQSSLAITDLIINNTNVPQTVTYTVSPTSSASGCSSPQIINVTVNPKPVMTSSTNTASCSGTALNYPLTANIPSSFTWIATDNSNTTGESTTLQNSNTINNNIINNSLISQTLTYTVTPTTTAGGCLGNFQTVTATVNALPSMTSANNATICSGNPINLALTSNLASSYKWIASDNLNTTGESTTIQTSNTINNVITNSTLVPQILTYTVTPTSTTGSCVGNTQIISVTVNSGPVMTSPASATICSGAAINIPFTANVASSYTWIASDNTNTSGESTTIENTSILNNTIINTSGVPQILTYTVTPTASCPGISQTITITVNPAPSMTSTNSATICNGSALSIPLAASITSTFTWIATDNSNTTGESLTSQNTSTINNTITNSLAISESVNYTVIPTSNTGSCTGNSQIVTVTVNPSPTITSSNNSTICNGTALNIPLTSNIPATFTWIAADNSNTSGESLSSQNTSTINNTITNTFAIPQTVIYTVTPTATTSSCIGNNQTVTVTVNPSPTVTSSNTSIICSGVTMNFPLSSNIPSTFTWVATDNTNTNGESVTSQNTSLLNDVLSNLSLVQQTVNYMITPTSNTGGCSGNIQTLAVTVNPAPAITSTNSATICNGSVLSVPLTADVPSTFSWIATDNSNTTGESLTSQNTSTINNTITNSLAVSQTVKYTVIPTSSTGSCIGNSQVVTVIVNPSPTISSSNNATTCNGTALNIPLTSNIPATFTWIAADNSSTTGESLSSQNTSTINNTITNTFAIPQTVIYTVTPTATTGSCIGNNQTVTVTVNPSPTVTSSNTSIICSGVTMNFPLSSNIPSTFTWVATDNTNTNGESVTSQNTSLLNDVLSNLSLVQQTVNYMITPTSNTGGCSGNIQTLAVTVNPAPAITSSNSATICNGSALSVPLTADVPSTFSWIATDNSNTTGESLTSQNTSTINNTITNSLAVSQTVNYTVIPTSNTGSCIGNSQAITVTVNPSPTVTSSNNAIICSGASVNISITSDIPSTFTWVATDNNNTNGENITTQTTSLIRDQIFNSTLIPQDVTYMITPTSITDGCINQNPQVLMVTVNAAPDITSSSTATICSGDIIGLSLTSNLPSSFNWTATDNSNTTGESLTSQNTSTLNDAITNNSTTQQTVNYSVIATANTTGCASLNPQPITVTVNPSPVITSADNTKTCSGIALNFPFTSDISSTFSWIAADNNNTSGESVTAQNSSALNDLIFNSLLTEEKVDYTVIATSISTGCISSSQTMIVTINPAPTVTSSNSATICSGNSIGMTLTSNLPSTFTWTATDNSNTTGESLTAQNASTLNDVIINNSITQETVNYTVIATSDNTGCVSLTPSIVSINIDPSPILTGNNTAITCSGVIMNFLLTSSIPSTFTWVAADNNNTNGESVTIQNSSSLSDIISSSSSVTETINYIITPTSINGGCVSQTPQLITVTVNPEPVIAPGSATLCSGNTIGLQLTANIPSVFSWIATDNSNTTGESVTAQSSSTINDLIINSTSVQETLNYTVFATANGTGCSTLNPQTFNVMVNPTPTVTSSNTASICSGTSVNFALTSSVPSTFNWVAADNNNTSGESLIIQNTSSVNDLISNSTLIPQTVNYTITPTALVSGCVTQTPQTFEVTVNPEPIVTVSNSATRCSGTEVGMALASSVPATFSWSATDNSNTTGESLTPQNTSTLSDTIINNSATQEVINYSVIVTANNTGCINLNPQTITVRVDPTPIVTISPSSTICSGNAVGIALASNIDCTFSWIASDNSNTNGENTTQQNSSTILDTILNNSLVQQTIIYTVNSTSTSGGCSLLTPENISVKVNPAPSFTNANTSTICSGTTVNIPLTSTLPSTFSWIAADNNNTNGESLTTQTTSTLNNTVTNSSVIPQVVTYTVTSVDSITGCSSLQPQLINVTVNASATANAGNDATICSGEVYTLSGIIGGSASSMNWSTNGTGAFDDATSSSAKYTPSASDKTSGSVMIILSTDDPAGACPLVTDSIKLTITPRDNASFTYGTSTLCQSGTNPNPTITGLSGGTFTTSSSQLKINPSTGIINLGLSTPGNYTVTYITNGSCPDSSIVNINVTDAPSAVFNFASSSYCQNSTPNPIPNFTTGSSGGIFTSTQGLVMDSITGQVNLTSSIPGFYTITNTIITSGGCAASIVNAPFTIIPLDNAAFNYLSQTYCQENTTVSPAITGLTGGSFTSSPGGLSLTSNTGEIALTSSVTGTYNISYLTSGSCPSTSNVNFIINPLPIANAGIDSLINCGTDSFLLNGIGSSTGTNFQYLWTTPNGNILSGNTTTKPSINKPGTYSLLVTDNNGCSATDNVNITGSFSYPDASFTTTPNTTTGTVPFVVTAINTSQNASNYNWVFENGETFSNAGNPTTTYTNAGTYTITLIASNNGQCADTSSVTIIVNPQEAFFIPEGFSPNGDGSNDLFEITGIERFKGNKLVIFNRWGNTVFEATPYNNQWNGKAKEGMIVGDDELPASTYYYVLDLGDGSKPIKGFIYLNK